MVVAMTIIYMGRNIPENDTKGSCHGRRRNENKQKSRDFKLQSDGDIISIKIYQPMRTTPPREVHESLYRLLFVCVVNIKTNQENKNPTKTYQHQAMHDQIKKQFRTSRERKKKIQTQKKH